MTALIILLILILLGVIIVQVSKVNELSSRIRGEEESYFQGNNRTALWMSGMNSLNGLISIKYLGNT